MLEIAFLAGIAVAVGSIFLLFGCICHLFKKSQPGFSSFENDVEVGQGQGFSIYSTQNSVVNQNESSPVTFEPLPDILAKTVAATALRPRITCIDREKQRNSAKHITVYRPFPRSQLIYLKEIGIGWFGQVLLGDAEKIHINSKKSRTVIKLLKDDASPTEKQLFLEEMAAFREIEHPNVIQLMGQCTESTPYLVILEHSPFGDLKSYLWQHREDADSMVRRGVLIDFMIDMAAGLACLHRHGYLHHDFSCRNCLVMSDLHIKVGDYGVAEDHFREDYYDTGQDLLPVRWMAPESLQLNNNIWQVTAFTNEANIWALGISLWEVSQFGERPYDSMSDEEVLHQVVRKRQPRISFPETSNPFKKRLNEIMGYCWYEEEQRPTAETVHSYLRHIQEDFHTQELQEQSEFDSKWEKASTKDRPVRKKKAVDVELETISTKKDSVCVQIHEPGVQNMETDHLENHKYVHIEPKVIVSNSTPKKSALSREQPKVHQAGIFPRDSTVIPMEPESVTNLPNSFPVEKSTDFVEDSSSKHSPVHKLRVTQEASESAIPDVHACVKSDKDILASKSLDSDDVTPAVRIPDGREEQTERASDVSSPTKSCEKGILNEDVNSNIHLLPTKPDLLSKGQETKSENEVPSEKNASFNATAELDESVILGGSELQEDELSLSFKEAISPFPSNKGTPAKGSSSSFRMTSTPVPMSTPAHQQEATSDYLTASSNQATQNGDGTKYFTAENTPATVAKRSPVPQTVKSESEMRTDSKSNKRVQEIYPVSPNRAPPRKSLSPRVLSQEMTEREVSEKKDKSAESEGSLSSVKSDQDVTGHENEDFSARNDQNEESEDESEDEKLKLLKLTLASALNAEGEDKSVEKKDGKSSGNESPVKDDLEIAKEIYMSKGTTIPPTMHTSLRSLNTIPEDDIPTDSVLPAGHIPSNSDSVLSTPTKLALKFEDPSDDFSGAASELFEWDDYISDDMQLVGDVKYSESSPRQSMEFPDWTLDNESSSQESDSKIMTKPEANSSASSTTESRPNSRASSIGTPYATSESEEYDSESESSDVPKADAARKPKKKRTKPKRIYHADDSLTDKDPEEKKDDLEKASDVKVIAMEEPKTPPTKPPRLKLTKPSIDESSL